MQVQNIVDHHHHLYAKTGSRVRFNEVTEEIQDVELIDVASDEKLKESLDDSVNDELDGKPEFNSSLLSIKPWVIQFYNLISDIKFYLFKIFFLDAHILLSCLYNW